MKRLPGKLTLAIFAAYLAVSAAVVGVYGADRIINAPDDHLSDLNVFYPAGALIVTDERGLIYDPDARNDLERPQHRGALGNFFNPPLFAVLFAPLTLLKFSTAQPLFWILTFVAAAGIACLAYYWSRSRFALVLAALAVVSYLPVYEAARSGQPSSIFALALGLALAAAMSGRWWGSALLGFVALKPSLVALPLGYVLYRGERRAIAAAIVSVLLLAAVPFAIVGFNATLDYLDLLSQARLDAFSLGGGITAGAAYMMNWNGFWGRLLVEDPSPFLVFPFYLATVLLMVRVWARGDIPRSWLACALATLLVTPHLLWYDWVIFLPPALAVAISRPAPLMLASLALVHLGANISTYQITGDNIFESDARFLLVATLAAFGLMFYLAFETEVEEWLARRGRPELVTETGQGAALP